MVFACKSKTQQIRVIKLDLKCVLPEPTIVIANGIVKVMRLVILLYALRNRNIKSFICFRSLIEAVVLWAWLMVKQVR